MDYPSGFKTPAFPAGKHVAISRFMAIAILSVCFVIIALCGLVFWSSKSTRIEPFVVIPNELTGQWDVTSITRGAQKKLEYSPSRLMQEYVIGNFMRNWFFLSDDIEKNEDLWASCERKIDCVDNMASTVGVGKCALYCAAGEDVFSDFLYNVVPDYLSRQDMGERLSLDTESLRFTPLDSTTDMGGAWRVEATLESNLSNAMNIIVFVKVGRNITDYPQAMGFYITDFNAYRLK